MTYEEAIKYLYDNCTMCTSDNEYRATEIAIESISKQIPKKVHRNTYYIPFCECGNKLTTCEQYCPRCGQRISFKL